MFQFALKTSALANDFRLGAFLTISLLLTGCAAVAPKYQGTNDNVRELQSMSRGKVAVGNFTTKDDSLNHLSIRAGDFSSPYNDSYTEYLKEALKAELINANRLDPKSSIVITGELVRNELDAAMSTGTAHIAARIVICRESIIVFDKTVSGDTEWDSSFLGPVAIPAARQHYAESMKRLLNHLFADPDFKKLF